MLLRRCSELNFFFVVIVGVVCPAILGIIFG